MQGFICDNCTAPVQPTVVIVRSVRYENLKRTKLLNSRRMGHYCPACADELSAAELPLPARIHQPASADPDPDPRKEPAHVKRPRKQAAA